MSILKCAFEEHTWIKIHKTGQYCKYCKVYIRTDLWGEDKEYYNSLFRDTKWMWYIIQEDPFLVKNIAEGSIYQYTGKRWIIINISKLRKGKDHEYNSGSTTEEKQKIWTYSLNSQNKRKGVK